MSTVTITESPLALEDLLAVVDGAQVRVSDGARAAIAASRAVVDHALASNEAVYSLTTQVGHGKDTRLTAEEIRGDQSFLVMSHSGGIGPPLRLHTCAQRWPYGSMALREAAPVPRQESPRSWRPC